MTMRKTPAGAAHRAMTPVAAGLAVLLGAAVLGGRAGHAGHRPTARQTAARPAPPVDARTRGSKKMWWKEAVIYQIYPRSFKDANGDGIGDLPGVIGQLDYLADLGVDVLWLCPIFKSPNADNGYDISDYRAIMPEFGTMGDFDRLVREAKARGLRIVLDLVANHSSDEHPWFVESRTSKANPFRDYYIWRPPKNGREPNDWLSFFGGKAWELDPATGEYYLHLFAKKQPDLNWDNPQVRREIYDVMRFWLDKGIAGWRMDVVPFYSKDPAFPDYPAGFDGDYARVYARGPRLHEYLREMKREVLSRYDMMTVGEGIGVPAEDAPLLVDERRGSLSMIYHFDHLVIDRLKDNFMVRRPEGVSLVEVKAVFEKWDRVLGDTGWASVLLGNHDFPRMVSRFGDDTRHRAASAKLLGTLLLTMKGTPYVYQGDELGMTNVPFASIDEFDDIGTKSAYRAWVAAGRDPAPFLAMANVTSRDHARTPFHWDDSPNAGFTTGRPWIRLNPNYREINATAERREPDSVWSHFRRAIRLRKENPVLVYGAYKDVDPAHPQVFAYTRSDETTRMLVVLNWSSEARRYALPVPVSLAGLALGNYPAAPTSQAATGEAGPAGSATVSFTLRPWEALVYRLR